MGQGLARRVRGGTTTRYASTPAGPLAERTGTSVLFYLLDPHGDTIGTVAPGATTPSSRASGTPWGELSWSGTAPAIGFPSQFTDPLTGWVGTPARWYVPSLSRFASPDPLPGDPELPLSLNRYAYALDDPVSRSGASGLSALVHQDTGGKPCRRPCEGEDEDGDDEADAPYDPTGGVGEDSGWRPIPLPEPACQGAVCIRVLGRAAVTGMGSAYLLLDWSCGCFVVSVGDTRVGPNDIRTGIELQAVGNAGAFTRLLAEREGLATGGRLTLDWDRVGGPMPGTGLSTSFRDVEVTTTINLTSEGPVVVHEAVGTLAGGRNLELGIRLEPYLRPMPRDPLRLPVPAVSREVLIVGLSGLGVGAWVLRQAPRARVPVRSRGW